MSTEVLKSYVHNSPVETVTGPTESTVSHCLKVTTFSLLIYDQGQANQITVYSNRTVKYSIKAVKSSDSVLPTYWSGYVCVFTGSG